jgi:hypothetical protein
LKNLPTRLSWLDNASIKRGFGRDQTTSLAVVLRHRAVLLLDIKDKDSTRFVQHPGLCRFGVALFLSKISIIRPPWVTVCYLSTNAEGIRYEIEPGFVSLYGKLYDCSTPQPVV